jgi:hypothetical protein
MRFSTTMGRKIKVCGSVFDETVEYKRGYLKVKIYQCVIF